MIGIWIVQSLAVLHVVIPTVVSIPSIGIQLMVTVCWISRHARTMATMLSGISDIRTPRLGLLLVAKLSDLCVIARVWWRRQRHSTAKIERVCHCAQRLILRKSQRCVVSCVDGTQVKTKV